MTTKIERSLARLALITLLGCSESYIPQSQSCIENNDCGDGLICANGTCQAINSLPGTPGNPCRADDTCINGYECVSNICTQKPIPGTPLWPGAIQLDISSCKQTFIRGGEWSGPFGIICYDRSKDEIITTGIDTATFEAFKTKTSLNRISIDPFFNDIEHIGHGILIGDRYDDINTKIIESIIKLSDTGEIEWRWTIDPLDGPWLRVDNIRLSKYLNNIEIIALGYFFPTRPPAGDKAEQEILDTGKYHLMRWSLSSGKLNFTSKELPTFTNCTASSSITNRNTALTTLQGNDCTEKNTIIESGLDGEIRKINILTSDLNILDDTSFILNDDSILTRAYITSQNKTTYSIVRIKKDGSIIVFNEGGRINWSLDQEYIIIDNDAHHTKANIFNKSGELVAALEDRPTSGSWSQIGSSTVFSVKSKAIALSMSAVEILDRTDGTGEHSIIKSIIYNPTRGAIFAGEVQSTSFPPAPKLVNRVYAVTPDAQDGQLLLIHQYDLQTKVERASVIRVGPDGAEDPGHVVLGYCIDSTTGVCTQVTEGDISSYEAQCNSEPQSRFESGECPGSYAFRCDKAKDTNLGITFSILWPSNFCQKYPTLDTRSTCLRFKGIPIGPHCASP